MRYIGNKENIIERIDGLLQQNGVTGSRFFDFFAGTTNVGQYYKRKGYAVESSDVMYLSYCLQKAYIENNAEPKFAKLLPTLNTATSSLLFCEPLQTVIDYLNTLKGIEGFVWRNYTPEGTADLEKPRMYFIGENGKKIDAIRVQIEEWKKAELLTENEYYILLACLIESVSFFANVAGVYAAFQKQWDPRAVKPFALRLIGTITSDKQNKVHWGDSMDLLEQINTDILYLDPPYNERQYLPNYHVLETIARYDTPNIHGVTGMRDYAGEKSLFCNARTALACLEKVANTAKYRCLAMSYNSEGIMPQEEILATLGKYGTVKLEQFEYLRFKSNNNGESKTKKHIFEQVYILQR